MPSRASEEPLAWEATCSVAVTTDVIWKLDAYRAALFLLHVARGDCRAMRARQVGEEVLQQLVRAAASVSANLGEGYSRSTRADRLRFLTYALGSTRECQSWYLASRDELPDSSIEERLLLLARIRSLLLGLIRALRESMPVSRRFEN